MVGTEAPSGAALGSPGSMCRQARGRLEAVVMVCEVGGFGGGAGAGAGVMWLHRGHSRLEAVG